MKLIKYAVALAGLGMAASTVLAGNVPIVNGDFALPDVGGIFGTYYAGDNTSIPGWSVTAGSIDLIGSYWPGPDGAGNQSVDMDGLWADGTIQQSGISLGLGSADVSFFINANRDGAPTIKTLLVDLIGPGGALTTQTFTYDDSALTGWVSEDAIFDITTAGSYTLQFASGDADINEDGGQSAFGAALANVSMNESSVPDGGSTVMLCGMSLAALGWLRRKLA